MNYKEVFELAESKGYKPFKCAFCGEILINQTYESKCQSCVIQHEIYPAMRTEWNSDYPEDELRLYLLQKWLRDTHKIYVQVNPSYYNENSYCTCWGANVWQLEWGTDNEHRVESKVREKETHDEALLQGIEKALNLI